MELDFIATTTFGLESIVKRELKSLGIHDVEVFNGKLEFKGPLSTLCKTNINLRCADRVLVKMGEFKATSFEELYEETKKLNWELLIPQDGSFPVSKIASVKSALFSKSDSQSIIKKAVVDRLLEQHGCSTLPETGALYAIHVKILNDIVTISVDSSGQGLHKRGYRKQQNEAPIKETLAAALVILSDWNPSKVLFDPTCGTGTILIEAAMIARNIAPGAERNFVSEDWDIIPERFWVEERDLAYSNEDWDKKLNLFGVDIDAESIEIAKENVKKAGLEDSINLKVSDAKKVRLNFKTGTIISNPPYGERLEDIRTVEFLYTDLGFNFKKNFKDWSYFIITSNENFETLFDKKADKKRKLYNGRIQCNYYQYFTETNK